ncbi:DUF1302 domain-containing protein [Algicola sagamiensis]|uniref:DUF1302 domain-containing protein n=1 Tax=Algicola sagamiensis TaxID=163869 RepID=UPI00036D45DA|nr:DUF1302 domain-containing protein [Algicola sagamiensis]
MSKGLSSKFTKNPIAVGITSALLTLTSQPVLSASFNFGDFDLTFDSTFSVGASWRVENRDMSARVGKSNNAELDWSDYQITETPRYDSAFVWDQTGSYSTNGDNGNLNYDPSETFSKLFKGVHDLDFKYSAPSGEFTGGAFIRFMYFYDFELMDEERPHQNMVASQSSAPVDAGTGPCEDEEAKDLVCRDIRLLDGYLYGDFEFGENAIPVTVRVGNQVLAWGEANLISHGINISPVDIARLKAPGSELKEAFIPTGMVFVSVGATEDITIETFYQYQWEETQLPVPGSYFSTNDFAGKGGYKNNVQISFAQHPDMNLPFLISQVNAFGSGIDASQKALIDEYLNSATSETRKKQIGAALSSTLDKYVLFGRKTTLRPKDGVTEPKDGGQYGFKFGILLPEWNDTELGFYYMNYHSRRPLISGTTSNFNTAAMIRDLQKLERGLVTEDTISDLEVYSKATLSYPEDIKLFGVSFNTPVGESAMAGELVYRQDEPLQADDVELLYAAVPEQLANSDYLAEGGISPDSSVRALEGLSQLKLNGRNVLPGETANGFILKDSVQAAVNLSHVFGPVGFFDNLSLFGEVGFLHILDMPQHSEMRLNGPGTDRNGGLAGKEGLGLTIQDGFEQNPFPNASSWGYRFVTQTENNNIFSGINLKSRLVFSHDVNGISPDPIFLFVEDRQSLGMTFSFSYQSRLSADFAYNAFWGGVGSTNTIEDRDYVSFSIKYSI